MKGQITVFIALGLVLLAVAGLTIHIFVRSTTSAVTIEKFIEETQELTELEQQYAVCLRDALEEGIETICAQGGLWDVLDTNAITKEYTIGGVRTNVSVAVGKPQSYPEGKIANLLANPTPQFGIFRVPALCDSDGPNAQNITCPAELYGPPSQTVQSKLRVFVHQKMQTCAEYRPDVNDIEILFTPEHTIASMRGTIGVSGSDFSLSIRNLRVRVNARLLHLYEFAYRMLYEDSYDPLFNKSSGILDCTYGPCRSKQEFYAIFAQPVEGHFPIQFRDERSVMRGSPLQLWFMIENRPPFIELSNSQSDLALNISDPDDRSGLVVTPSDQGTCTGEYTHCILLSANRMVTATDAQGLQTSRSFS